MYSVALSHTYVHTPAVLKALTSDPNNVVVLFRSVGRLGG